MTSISSSLVRGLSIAAVCHLGVSTASAQLTHYVPFDAGYFAGVDLHTQGGQDLGFGANVWFDGGPLFDMSIVNAGNLNAPAGLPVAGQHASTHPLDFNLAFYTFDRDGDGANGEPEDALEPGEHWISFVANANVDAFFGGLSLVKFFGDEVLYIGKVGGAGGTEWGLDPGGSQMTAGGDITQDTFIVCKLTIGPVDNDDTVDMWLDPALSPAPLPAPDLSIAFNEDPLANRGIDEIRLGSQNGPFMVDEIRIGATFADVAPGGTDPCLAIDFLTDGILDNGDINAFISLFTGGDLAADINGDGILDNGDIQDFIALFLACV